MTEIEFLQKVIDYIIDTHLEGEYPDVYTEALIRFDNLINDHLHRGLLDEACNGNCDDCDNCNEMCV